GIEVKTSHNHPGVINDICDNLAGKYPKNFIFDGWHPQCRCFAIPLLPSTEEFNEFQKSVLEGNDPNDFNFSYTRQTLSPGYNKWLAEHTKEIKSAKYIPQFITNNVNLIQEITEIKPKQKLVAKAAKATKTVEQSTSLESIVKSDAPKE